MYKKIITRVSVFRAVIKLIECMIRNQNTELLIYWKYINPKNNFWEFNIVDFNRTKTIYESDKK